MSQHLGVQSNDGVGMLKIIVNILVHWSQLHTKDSMSKEVCYYKLCRTRRSGLLEMNMV